MEIREAVRADLDAIVRLLADDQLGSTRERIETPQPQRYLDAFEAVTRQEGNSILVAVEDGAVIGCLQITLIHGVSRQGVTRAQIEGVRVAASARGKRIGETLVRHAVEAARAAGCGLVQLTTDKRRKDAHRFYERLGFEASHVGMKLSLS